MIRKLADLHVKLVGTTVTITSDTMAPHAQDNGYPDIEGRNQVVEVGPGSNSDLSERKPSWRHYFWDSWDKTPEVWRNHKAPQDRRC